MDISKSELNIKPDDTLENSVAKDLEPEATGGKPPKMEDLLNDSA